MGAVERLRSAVIFRLRKAVAAFLAVGGELRPRPSRSLGTSSLPMVPQMVDLPDQGKRLVTEHTLERSEPSRLLA